MKNAITGRAIRATALNVELVGIDPCVWAAIGLNEQIFGADEQAPKGGCGRCPKNHPPRVIDNGCKQEVFGPPVTQSGRADTATLDPLC
jgi:hypothetical protein